MDMAFKSFLGRISVISLALTLAGCGQPAKVYLDKGRSLSQAGFVAHYADTTARYSMMNLLPPGQITYRPAPEGGNIYLYADPIGCGCVYMGDQNAYDTLKAQDKTISKNHSQQDPSLTEMVFENRRDTTAWDWSSWTPAADPGSNQPKHMIGSYW